MKKYTEQPELFLNVLLHKKNRASPGLLSAFDTDFAYVSLLKERFQLGNITTGDILN